MMQVSPLIKWLKWQNDKNVKGICDLITYPFLIEFLCNLSHQYIIIMCRYTPSVNGLNIRVLTMDLYQGKKYTVGVRVEKWFCDITVLYLMYS